jgi:hypothetical protein
VHGCADEYKLPHDCEGSAAQIIFETKSRLLINQAGPRARIFRRVVRADYWLEFDSRGLDGAPAGRTEGDTT